MNREEKAKRYDEAIERAKNTIEVNQTIPDIVECVESLFPELKESEDNDEKIRKALIALVKCNERSGYTLLNNVSTSSMIAWLEKQGEKDRLIQELGEYKVKYTQEVLEKHINDMGESAIEAVDNVDKVEPKFKVGDWFVDTIIGGVWRIDGFDKENYQVSDSKGNYNCCSIMKQDEIEIWTIKNAKDGDVLVTNNYIFIFKNIDDDGGVHYYCHYEIFKHEDDGQFGIAAHGSIMGRTFSTQYSPATKEQRDQLEKAMRDAGYTFDFKKNELKKIEQNPVLDVEIPFGAKDSELIEEAYFIPEGFHAEIIGSEVHIKRGEQKPAWSEEDEEFWDSALWHLKNSITNGTFRSSYECPLTIWFKSLKDRVGCATHFTTTKEWSEEDEKNFARVDYACLKVYGGDSYSSDWLRKFLGIHKK